MYKIAVFDLDGTLFNTMPDLLPAFNAAVEKYGYAPATEAKFGRIVGSGFRESITRILPESFDNPEQFDDMCKVFLSVYAAHYADKTFPYPGIADALTALSALGVRTAVLSNKQASDSANICEKLLPDTRFDRVCGAGEGYPLKPDPAHLNALLAETGVTPDEAIFIGDSDVDVITAHNSGLKCIGCEWGFRGREELERAGADFFARVPADIVKIIKEKE